MTAEQLKELEDRLWQAADKLRVDSGLKASEYATPILGLIFLRFASLRYDKVKKEIEKEMSTHKNSRMQRQRHEIAIEKCGFYLPPEAEYEYLLNLPEKEDIAKAIKVAMEKIELYKPELTDSLPKDEYFKLVKPDDRSLPKSLLKTFADIPDDVTGDVFGKVYEYFLAEFALAEGQGGGEFFTPTSVVKLMVEIIEPYHGTIFDPACGSGGMFVQSSYFVDRRREELHDTDTKDLMVYGAERTPETVKLARMNLAVNGLRGEIRPANSYYEDPFGSYGHFDYVMANPPFNVNDVNLDKVKGQRRFNEYGIPQNKTKNSGNKGKNTNTIPNANYLWISLFATSLKPKGRAALVMANSASDARNSEAEIRRNLVQSGVIDCMLSLPKNMFYTVTLPATLWFFEKGKKSREPKVLFIDARSIFRQVNRALREFTEEHIQNIATIVRLYRGETERFTDLLKKYKKQATDFEKQAAAQGKTVEKLKKSKPGSEKDLRRWEKEMEATEREYRVLHDKKLYYEDHIQWLQERFPNGVYEDVIGLCKVATLTEIEEQDWSMNPGRYVGVVVEEDGLTEEEFRREMMERKLKLDNLDMEACKLIKSINNSFKILIENA
ncbi:MAG: N-6 DNA methylase [Chitinophagaceae bacterium]|nr:N-6 DNA methylase [Chitinophagaceae bacterium]